MSHIRIILPQGANRTRSRMVRIRKVIEDMGAKCIVLKPPMITKELLLEICSDSKDGLDILLSRAKKDVYFTAEELYFLREGVYDYSLMDALDILLDNPKYMTGVIYHNPETGVCFAGLVDGFDSIIRRDIMGSDWCKLRRQIVSQENIIETWNKLSVGDDSAISEEWYITNQIKPPKRTRGRGRNKQANPQAKGKAKGGKDVDDYTYY